MDIDHEFLKESCEDFLEKLASKAPVPGGGGASSYVVGLGASLFVMFLNLSIGKKRYAQNEALLINSKEESLEIIEHLKKLVKEDADGFLPLSRAYGLPSNTEEERKNKEKIMEEALYGACQAPIAIMKYSKRIIELIELTWDKGSKLALSDATSAIYFALAGMKAASLNVYINSSSMGNRKIANDLEDKVENLLTEGQKICKDLLPSMLKKLKTY